MKTTFYFYTLFSASSNLWKLQPSVDICEWQSLTSGKWNNQIYLNLYLSLNLSSFLFLLMVSGSWLVKRWTRANQISRHSCKPQNLENFVWNFRGREECFIVYASWNMSWSGLSRYWHQATFGEPLGQHRIAKQLFQACCKHLIVPHSNLLDTHK